MQQLAGEMLDAARAHQASPLSGSFWSDQLMQWALSDPAFKVELFRFVDVFPALRTPDAIHRHLQEYLWRDDVPTPMGLKTGLRLGGMMKGVLAKTTVSRIERMASTFIAGRDAADAMPRLRKLWDAGIGFSIDLLGEACLSDAEARAYQQRYLDVIETLGRTTLDWPDRPAIERDHLGPVPRANVSIKITSLAAKVDPMDFEGSIDRLAAALEPILAAAAKHGVFVNFDMEHHHLKDLTTSVFERCCERHDFSAGLAMQAYLRSGDDDLRRVIAWAKRTGRRVTVRLVKGAYWDYEQIEAERQGWPVPVWLNKAETDACFERMAAHGIANTPRSAGEGGVTIALGSHNARSLAVGLAAAEAADLPKSAVEVQMLYGMAGSLKTMVVERGLRLREYVPAGEMIPGMAYLVRRLLENTSNESWLRHGSAGDESPERLLADPHASAEAERVSPPSRSGEAMRHALSVAIEGVGDGRPFLNEPMRDFADAGVRRAFAEAVARAGVPAVANDATEADADAAVGRAIGAFPAWRDTPPEARAGVLTRAAGLMRERRDELAGVMIREAGKPWAEADGDVCEAIDFCEYYARQAVALSRPERLGRYLGELNEQWHEPRGVAAVISPWNFPLAICTGMTAAALVTGNAVIVKPAEQTPGIARIMCDILREAGAPRDALRFLPGVGETVGAALVRDPRVALVAFTGSKDVGLDIVRATGVTLDEQTHVKQVIAEMGGKNAIIVDASADLDEAVAGVRASAFGYSGQKCSACSRAIVLDEVYDAFVQRLVNATASLITGDPLDPATDVGPVIDDAAAQKVRRYIEIGNNEGRLALGENADPASSDARLIPPHIFTDIRPEHRLAREEVFGPVLAVMRASDFDHALTLANDVPYRLTGGVYSRTPSHLEKARRGFRVGNLYLNRTITGALVGRQPFGGFGLSGVGSKAGGDEYLLRFVVPRCVAENTLRRGFSPELAD